MKEHEANWIDTEVEQNYNFTKTEVDLIGNAIEHFCECMDVEDRLKYEKKFNAIIEKLELN